MNPNSFNLQGYEPVAQTISEFQMNEIQALQQPKAEAVKISVAGELRRRKVYVWLWADVTNTADYWVKAELQFFKNGSRLGSMPISVAVGTASGAMTSSLASVCVTGGVAGSDTIGLYVGNPQAGQPTNVLLQPQYINGVIDEIKLAVNEIRNVSTAAGMGVRAWLGCISSQL